MYFISCIHSLSSLSLVRLFGGLVANYMYNTGYEQVSNLCRGDAESASLYIPHGINASQRNHAGYAGSLSSSEGNIITVL